MLKIMVSQWDKNRDKLRDAISRLNIQSLDYKDLVELTFETIYNTDIVVNSDGFCDELDTQSIHEFNDGDYQGTLLYLIPFDTYQPGEYEYLMTYARYGSCSGCDALRFIKCLDDEEQVINEVMTLCKDLITNAIKPYNEGWRENDYFEHVEEKKNGN